MLDTSQINFDKLNGLIPVCVQDHASMQLLMLGFMNKQALEQTLATQKVTFWSRSKKRLWVKGETSGNYLHVISLSLDCDHDSLLIYAKSAGPTCHTGDTSCFKTSYTPALYCLAKLDSVIENRYLHPVDGSYTTQLFQQGTKRIAQKVGEEGVEVALAAVAGTKNELADEVADLLFHLLVLLKNQQLPFDAIMKVLQTRMKQ